MLCVLVVTEAFHLVSYIPRNEMVVLAVYMNRHVGSSNVGYCATGGQSEGS